MIHDPTPAADARALITETCLLNGHGPPASVLICDDRPAALHNLSQMLRPLPFLLDISWAPDGFTLLDTVAARPVDLVLIGIHRANTTGTEATNLLLSMHPATVIIVYGTPADIHPLATTLTRGARGILLWNTELPHP